MGAREKKKRGRGCANSYQKKKKTAKHNTESRGKFADGGLVNIERGRKIRGQTNEIARKRRSLSKVKSEVGGGGTYLVEGRGTKTEVDFKEVKKAECNW